MKFEKIAIQWIALSDLRTTDPSALFFFSSFPAPLPRIFGKCSARPYTWLNWTAVIRVISVIECEIKLFTICDRLSTDSSKKMSDDDLSELDSDKSDTHENEKSSCGEPPPKSAKKLYTQQFRPKWLEDPKFKDWLVPPAHGKKNPHAKHAVNRYRLARPHFKDIVKLRYTRRQYQANKDRKTLFRVCDGRWKSAYTRKQQRLEHVPFLQSITSRSV